MLHIILCNQPRSMPGYLSFKHGVQQCIIILIALRSGQFCLQHSCSKQYESADTLMTSSVRGWDGDLCTTSFRNLLVSI